MARISTPAHLLGATEFSAERDTLSPLWYVRTLKQTRWLWQELEDGTRLDKNWGRDKEPGHWALAYLGFVVSGQVDIEPWWKNSDDAFWRECGFSKRPPYPTAYERLTELESVAGEFTNVAAKLIQHCRRHEPLIGAHVHVDGTEAETHAFLTHDCRPGEGCKHGGASPRRTAKRPKRVTTDTVREERHKEAEKAPLEDGDRGVEAVRELPDGRKRVKVGGCWFRTLDSTAGIRAYGGPRGSRKFWHGFYNIKAVDHYTGAPVAVGVYNASKNEHHCYPDLLERVLTAVGDTPEAVIADRGFSLASVFALNTNLGIASVMPWRKANQHERRHDQDTHDRHGIPRCRHCGAPGTFVRFRVADKGPRLWFRCERGTTPACQSSEQSISCSKDWRLLVPLWRVEPVYHELKQSHDHYERVHRLWRERYKVAGDSLACRPKRRGLPWQELRAQAALVAEWLVLAWREGWLGSARRNGKESSRNPHGGQRAADALIRFRARFGVRKPYGPKAHALGIGQLEPPSRRKKEPPGPEPPEDELPF